MTLPKVIRGKAWKFGNNIDTDQIIPAKYAIYSLDEKELGKHACEGVPGREAWASEVPPGDIGRGRWRLRRRCVELGMRVFARARAGPHPGRRRLAGHRRLFRQDFLSQRDQHGLSD